MKTILITILLATLSQAAFAKNWQCLGKGKHSQTYKMNTQINLEFYNDGEDYKTALKKLTPELSIITKYKDEKGHSKNSEQKVVLKYMPTLKVPLNGAASYEFSEVGHDSYSWNVTLAVDNDSSEAKKGSAILVQEETIDCLGSSQEVVVMDCEIK